MLRKIFLFSLILMAFSCSPGYRFKKDAKIKMLGVKLTYSDTIYPELGTEYKTQLGEFISKFNLEKHAFKLYQVDKMDTSSVELKIKETKLVSVGQQFGALGLTVAGLVGIGVVAPFLLTTVLIPSTVVWWLIPNNKTVMTMKLSENLRESEKDSTSITFLKGAYFGNKEAQLRKVKKKIPLNYRGFFNGFETIYKQQRLYYSKKNSSASK